MSNYISKFPRKNKLFNQHLVGTVPYINDNSIRLRVNGDYLSTLNSLIDDPSEGWTYIYKLTAGDGTATKVLRKKRNILRKKIEKILLAIFKDIPFSLLTTEDRSALRLNQPKETKTRAPKMKKAPILSLEKMQHLSHKLRFKNPETAESSAMPYKQHIVLETYIGAAGIKDKDIPWANAQDVTRFLYTKSFTEADVLKYAYYRCCYENSRGERSIWSKIIKVAIA